MSVVKRGSKFHFDAVIAGVRHRCSLGTSDAKAAARLSSRVSFAVAEGPRSPVWEELRLALPVSSFNRLTAGTLSSDPLKLTELEQKFLDHIERREQLGQIGKLSRKNYERTSKLFFDRALESGLKKIEELTPEFVQSYFLWRKESITSRGGSGKGIVTDVVVLSALFNFAIEEGWMTKSPLRYKPKIPQTTGVVQPFTDEEMAALDAVEKSALEKAVFAVFRYTGLRCGDVANLLWSAFDWKTKTVRVVTAKRGKRVEVPVTPEFVRIMDDFFRSGYGAVAWIFTDLRTPGSSSFEEDRVFPGIKPHHLYQMVRGWGEKADVRDCHPHRFRHYTVCHWLAKGLTLFDVSQLIGDTTAVTEKHYSQWTNGQKERIRGIMNSEED